MKPMFHHSSSILLFSYSVTLLIISIINIPTGLCEDDKQYTNCNTAFTCAKNISSNLKYPFWGGVNRLEYCGGVDDPNTKLTCEDGGVPKITISNIKYIIHDWDNTTQKLNVSRDDYSSGDVCENDDSKSSTFNNTQFQQFGGVFNVTLLYGCDLPTGNPANRFRYNCSDSKYVVYAVGNYPVMYSGLCTPSVTVTIPILETQAVQLMSGNGIVSNVLKDGFDLRWTGNDGGQCQRCVSSGGACGNDGGTEFRCFCKDGPRETSCLSDSDKVSSSSNSSKTGIIIGAVVGVGALVFILGACFLVRRRKKNAEKMSIFKQQQSSLIPLNIFRERRKLVDHNVEVFMRSYNLSMPRRYSYKEVKRITNSFRNKLGQGGYGVVYKAILSDGRQVAVKLINESKGNGEEFINEVASISKTSHMNVVSLLGFSYEVNKRALIYEFMPKGSLDKFIYKREFPNAICDFDWNTLFQIAIGIARGLEYLHHGCSSRILHLDIKPQNILLDEDFCPKISDFGLAKICQRKDSIVSILGTRGTAGYMAPEVLSRAFGGVSYKSDVYSYGMLILEMIGGRKNYDTGGTSTSEMYFPDWIYKDLEQGNTLLNCSIISEEENDMVRKITLVSLWCIQTKPSDRPPMNKVIDMLLGPLSSVSYTPKPVLCSPERPPLEVSDMSSSDLYETNSIMVSK
ncbi:LEAF RUST 10 DISEASE-RESISTANCE LOCUS RECEPTOR-LIKE PROTEIN KINASE-like 2.4 isoform X1 [Trifolium pratense]|uniref:LEAF RUST 10 DISEASE-RESISTANCE LOCUS RECEPTOR-LIKE PROTEIN KINASE-like 2.4 isoform X1 n=1 Tax=Trifolium pratense TaxID=57577 RepID=UPI001E68FEA8|nr:LEAF RUST 10 DISEASE-RESISTANCE LOCUS RECEPTOR-LIKE PROTEIN KINASE-like 2.4 isoform X1 [Trifolium pratense]